MALEEGARVSSEKLKGKVSLSRFASATADSSQLCCLFGSWLETPVYIANHFSLPLGRTHGLADGPTYT